MEHNLTATCDAPDTRPPMVKFKESLVALVTPLVVMWIVEIVNTLIGHRLSVWGILPRESSHLIGIPFSPFLHGSIEHLSYNSVPYLVLGGLVSLQGRRKFILATLFIIGASGLLLWIFGRSSLHVGASGLIFGYFGYLIFRAWYDRSLSSLAIAALVVFLYGGILWGLNPTQSMISWEGHLFGLLAGAICARIQTFNF